jgi:hypothetical protein
MRITVLVNYGLIYLFPLIKYGAAEVIIGDMNSNRAKQLTKQRDMGEFLHYSLM